MATLRQLPEKWITNRGTAAAQFPLVTPDDKAVTPPGFRNTVCAVQLYKDATPQGLRKVVEIGHGSQIPEGCQLCSGFLFGMVHFAG